MIAVIIPALNEADNIAEVVEQLQAQADVDEVIVVDNGSTDDTAKIANERYSRLTYLYQQNCGVSAARNL